MWSVYGPSHVNVTEEQLHNNATFKVQLRTYQVMIPILGIIIIILNLIVVFSSGLILRRRLKPRSTYIFLGNVALADLLTGTAVIIGQYGPRNSEMNCCIEIGLIISATLASVYSIGLIAIDRYFYILYGLFYNQYIPTARARVMILTIWILGIVVGFLPAMGVRNSIGVQHCWLILLEPTALLITTVCIGVIPLFVTLVLYGIILKSALGKISEISRSNGIAEINKEVPNRLRYFRGSSNRTSTDSLSNVENNAQENAEEIQDSKVNCFCCRFKRKIPSVYTPSRWKAIKIVLLTTGCYAVTWFPYFIACAIYATCDPGHLSGFCESLRIAIASPLAILGLANSILNPIIYAWWHNGFRESAKNAYNDIWRRLRAGTSISNATTSVATTTTRPIPVVALEAERLSSANIANYLSTDFKCET